MEDYKKQGKDSDQFKWAYEESLSNLGEFGNS